MGSLIQRSTKGNSREMTEALLPSTPPIPSQGALTCKRGGEGDGGSREVGGGGKMAGECGKVPIIVANLTVGPDGCGGWAIYFGGGASQEEALTYHGRQSLPEGIPPGWKSQEDQEVPAWHSCSSGDLVVPKEH